MNLVTFTTDFGTRDWFAGTMKGVLAGLAPGARVVDLTHEIPPGDVYAAAFSLLCSYRFFPPGTIHLVVVDPGVGSDRKALAVRTAQYVFVGPDNGVLSWALRSELVLDVRLLENRDYFLAPVSNTFHGRDVFSPVAAHLARGASFESVGSSVGSFVRLDWWEPVHTGGKVEGRIIHIDRFGNGITNIPNPDNGFKAQLIGRLETNRVWKLPCKAFYQAVPVSAPVVVPGSTGYVEVAVNGGSAEKVLQLKRGCPVILEQLPTGRGTRSGQAPGKKR
jgi:S-adenosylmethionine hydrolase